MDRHYKSIFNLASLAGQILLESGAEEYRVEDTTLRILQTSGLDRASSFSNTTGLFLSLSDTDYTDYAYSNVIRINERDNDIQKINAVNDISRQYTSGEINVKEAYEAMKDVREIEYSLMVNYTNILLIMSFVVLFNGFALDILISLIMGIILYFIALTRKFIYYTDFSFNVVAAMVITALVFIINQAYPHEIHPHILIAAFIIPFYPNTLMTNASRDLLKGNNIAGLIKATDAFIIFFSLTLGIGLGVLVANFVGTYFI